MSLSKMSSLAENLRRFVWMSQYAPVFPARSHNISIIPGPVEFCSTLKTLAENSKHRIVLSSLYLGTSSVVQEFVDSIQKACEKHATDNSNFRVSVLLDYTRGTRGANNSITMLDTLLRKYPRSVSLSLYHTQELRGLWKMFLPARFNETIGVQHMKVYLFDDTLVMSGANLSETYFTNRQDRYVMIKEVPVMGDFLEGLIKVVRGFSFDADPDGTLKFNNKPTLHPFNNYDWGANFSVALRESVMEFWEHWKQKQNKTLFSNNNDMCRTENLDDTWVIPFIQYGPHGITMDEEVTTQLINNCEKSSRLYLASGYFNLTDEYEDALLNSDSHVQLLLASPQVNGFYGARGVSGQVPAAYTEVAKQFYNKILRCLRQHDIVLFEYYRDKWTFHAKGIWFYPPDEIHPILTLVGSPNFGYRSIRRDLELQLAIVTNDNDLRSRLHDEQTTLFSRGEQVTAETFEQPERQVPSWVKMVINVIRSYF